jgi:YesN/AraC family two-component response regulator
VDNSKEIVRLASSLKVLYVEDEAITRDMFSKHLNRFFKDLDTAADGQEGLEKAKAKKYDIIITDVQMPHMTGLQMLHEVKALGQEAKTVITTAFNDEAYFMDSIALGVDRYIIKPVKIEDLYRVIYDITKNIDNAYKAQELQAKEAQEKINQTAQSVMEGIANAYPSPTCVVSKDGKTHFVNNAFKELVTAGQLEAILDGSKSISDFFIKKLGFESTLHGVVNNPNHNKIAIQVSENKKRIFHVSTSNIDIPGIDDHCTIYSFADITALEFQKLRVKLYAEMLQDLVILKHKNSQQTVVELPNAEPSRPATLISSAEQEVLKQKRVSVAVSAIDYLAEMGDDVLEQVEELTELEEEVDDLIERFIMDQSTNSLQKLAIRFEMYSQTIDILIEFGNLALALKNLSYFLENITGVEMEKYSKKLTLYLGAIASDLKEWRGHIFGIKDAQDIHYLDTQLLSSCLQVQLECSIISRNDGSIGDDDGELELF